MSLFKKALGALGFGGVPNAPQFTPDTRQFDADTAKLRSIRDTEPTKLRKSTKIQQAQLEDDKNQSLSESEARGQGLFATAQQQQAIIGGLGSGANERLSRSFLHDQQLNNQKQRSLFAAQDSQLAANDFANQEGLKDKAAFALPGLGAEKSKIMTQAAANNMNAQAAARAGRDKRRSQTIGMIGGVFGGPMGAGIGQGIGAMSAGG